MWRRQILFLRLKTRQRRQVMTPMRPTVKVEKILVQPVTEMEEFLLFIVNLTIQEEEFCLANIYAPSDQNLPVDFYTQLTKKLHPYVNLNLVPRRDFNCPLENIDKKGGKDISSRKNVIQSIVKMSKNFKSCRHLETPASISHKRFTYTWQNSSGRRDKMYMYKYM